MCRRGRLGPPEARSPTSDWSRARQANREYLHEKYDHPEKGQFVFYSGGHGGNNSDVVIQQALQKAGIKDSESLSCHRTCSPPCLAMRPIHHR